VARARSIRPTEQRFGTDALFQNFRLWERRIRECKLQSISAAGAFNTGVLSERRFRAAPIKKVRKASTGMAENCFWIAE